MRNDYFCETVATVDNYNVNPYRLYSDNALWDGQDLLDPCYGNNNPPWFKRTLPSATTDDINAIVYIYSAEEGGSIALQQLEIYIR